MMRLVFESIILSYRITVNLDCDAETVLRLMLESSSRGTENHSSLLYSIKDILPADLNQIKHILHHLKLFCGDLDDVKSY